MPELPATMRAVEISGGSGPASALYMGERSLPVPQDGQVLIKAAAAGVNRPDVLQRMGFYPPPPGASDILGLEIAGRVVMPAGRWKIGDEVVALLSGGGYAGYAAADARHVLPVPAGLGSREAAALPETVFTVCANLVADGHLRSGETLLVHGATSGIGTAAIQIGKALGARVVATARGHEKAEAARALGTDVAIDTTVQDFAAKAKAGGGVDVVLDMVGAEYFARNLDTLKPGGRIVFIAGLGGMELTVPILQLMMKRAILTGSTLRARSADEKARLARSVEDVVWPWIEAGTVRPVIDRVFPMREAAAAHARMEANGHTGKIVLDMA